MYSPPAKTTALLPTREALVDAAMRKILECLTAQSPLPLLDVRDAVPAALARQRYHLLGHTIPCSPQGEADEGGVLLVEEALAELEAEGRVRREPLGHTHQFRLAQADIDRQTK